MPGPRDIIQGSAPRSALLSVLALAGVTGAAGVALAAVAAHKVESPSLATAAMMLMIHAGAALALVALSIRMSRQKGWLTLATVMLGAVALFSGDVTHWALNGAHLFPYAAPIGGSTLILSWLAVAVLALMPAKPRRE